ncbi:hypothetical protein [Persicobacter diffluens]|uniref:Cupin domain-containing protein n=1 Tax=Persicobacter diffluens TaxID=981 RepID=A0AAN4W5X9_9BACT|nr:hypothetical protein PEDI_54740 [Persicobacter diffluens]
MSHLVQSDNIYINPNESRNYNVNNPVWKISEMVEKVTFAAGREFYLVDSLDYLFPYKHLELYNTNYGDDKNLIGPIIPWEQQNDKNDFHKQNIRSIVMEHFYLVRGYISIGDDAFPFVKVSYDAGMKTPLSQATNHNIGGSIQMWCKIKNSDSQGLINLPYNSENDRYEVELWGYEGNDLLNYLEEKGAKALQDGTIQIRTDLVHGSPLAFSREAISLEGEPSDQDGKVYNINPNHTMHPIFALPVELAFTNHNASVWDSLNGSNYRVEFNMLLRGWKNYIQGGVSANPHGGVGYLEFRNLFSNYFNHQSVLGNELKRDLESWNLDADGTPTNTTGEEKFMAVEYMDLHILKPNCVIGIHRHKDNQEIFMMLRGSGLMVTGDWVQQPTWMRAFEVRNMRAGDLVLCKNGMLHSLMNLTDEDIELFMFGGYD